MAVVQKFVITESGLGVESRKQRIDRQDNDRSIVDEPHCIDDGYSKCADESVQKL